MYGMIHQAARDMAIEHLGPEGWRSLAAEAGLNDQHFIGVEYYSDAETMALVELIADRLKLPMDRALFEFGRCWIAFAGASAYGKVLQMAGGDLESFLDNLDRMHASIKSNMPLAKMPSFAVVASSPERFHVLYKSERDGLAPFVQGILAAVAERFGEVVAIRYTPQSDGVVFEITRSDAAAA